MKNFTPASVQSTVTPGVSSAASSRKDASLRKVAIARYSFWWEILGRFGLEQTSPIFRWVVLGALDTAAIVVTWVAVLPFVRELPMPYLLIFLTLIALTQIVVGSVLGLYRRRFALGSNPELRCQGMTAAFVLGVGAASTVPLGVTEDLSWLLLAMASGQIVMVVARQILRVWMDSERVPVAGERVVVIGAGELGATLISQMVHDPDSPYLPVAIVDDNPSNAKLIIDGVRVFGTTREVRAVVESTDATGVIAAIAQAPSELFASLVTDLDLGRVWVRTVPSLVDLLETPVGLSSIRDIDVSDLIGRQIIDPEDKQVGDLLRGKTVLVTGAGGSIGSELCRIISRHEPARLLMLDRDESELHSLCMSLEGRALMESPDLVLADIRDGEALTRLFTTLRPDIVVHAAALKHLPMLERFPDEGWKTNVHGTLNVLRAAHAAGAERFVNISTDKAANPSSELGRSKFLAERLTANFAERTGLPYVSVRFGNVLGSRGSVLLSFADQISRGGPLTVTHPDVTRFFMTIPEACHLVLQAAAEGRPGQTMVLDMGRAVKIVDLAQRMMVISGRTCPIAFTGLRAGEKLHEELFSPTEDLSRGINGLAWNVQIEGLDPAALPAAGVRLETIGEFYSREVLEMRDPEGATPTAEVVLGSSADPAVPTNDDLETDRSVTKAPLSVLCASLTPINAMGSAS